VHKQAAKIIHDRHDVDEPLSPFQEDAFKDLNKKCENLFEYIKKLESQIKKIETGLQFSQDNSIKQPKTLTLVQYHLLKMFYENRSVPIRMIEIQKLGKIARNRAYEHVTAFVMSDYISAHQSETRKNAKSYIITAKGIDLLRSK
jgi:DNA-binding MarR family transcriptional regulator